MRIDQVCVKKSFIISTLGLCSRVSLSFLIHLILDFWPLSVLETGNYSRDFKVSFRHTDSKCLTANALGSTWIRYQSDENISDPCLIDTDKMAFAIKYSFITPLYIYIYIYIWLLPKRVLPPSFVIYNVNCACIWKQTVQFLTRRVWTMNALIHTSHNTHQFMHRGILSYGEML